MKRVKFFALLTAMSLLSGMLGFSQNVKAECGRHSNYQDRVEATIGPQYTSHQVPTGYYVGDMPITQKCTISTTYLIHNVYCGVCGKLMTGYKEDVISHSLSHK